MIYCYAEDIIEQKAMSSFELSLKNTKPTSKIMKNQETIVGNDYQY